jgi:hypothetical protein
MDKRSSTSIICLLLLLDASTACARKPVTGGGLEDKGISVESRLAAPHERVFTAAARALTDLGYVVARRYLGATDRLLQAAPRLTWDDCVSADVAAASKHPGVIVFVITRAQGDSTLLRVGAETLTKVPNVVVRGSPMNADIIVKMCAIVSISARIDTLLREPALAPLAAESSAVASPAPASPDTLEYHRLLARLRRGDTLVDYSALRMAYTKTPQYAPYPVNLEAHSAMFSALERRRFAQVRAIADSILTTNYVDADAHLSAMGAAYWEGDSTRGLFHGAVYRGLIASIHNRSGRTPDSAIVVLSILEEYALLRALRLEMVAVAGMQCGPNLCDRIEATSLTGKRSVLYFDVGIPQTWAMRVLRRR